MWDVVSELLQKGISKQHFCHLYEVLMRLEKCSIITSCLYDTWIICEIVKFVQRDNKMFYFFILYWNINT